MLNVKHDIVIGIVYISPNNSTYTAAQKFPFKIAKQASTMNPDIIPMSCTYANSVTVSVYWVFYC